MKYKIEHFEKLCSNTEAFKEKVRDVNGNKVRIFDYYLAQYSDFKDNKENGSYECRGITFTYNSELKEWVANLLLEKFFNVNENEDWLFEKLKDKPIKSIQEKIDGSIVSFVRLQDGQILAKSKTSFSSDQALEAQKIYDGNKNLRDFVLFCLRNWFIPIFEFVSPENQIVINYEEKKLVLLKIRQTDGIYLSADEVAAFADKYGIEYAKFEKLVSLQELIDRVAVEEDKEGYVIDFGDMRAKLKTKWYVERHRIVGDNNIRDNVIIKAVLDKTFDDILAYLTPESFKYGKMVEIAEKTTKRFNGYIKLVEEFISLFENQYNSNKKDFAIVNKNHQLFGLVMHVLSKKTPMDESVKNYILKRCNHLKTAQEWLAEE